MRNYCPVVTEIKTYFVSTTITSYCVGITFQVPEGGNPCRVNGYSIPAGGSLEITQSTNNLDVSKYRLVFESGSGSDEVNVIRLVPQDVKLENG
jgi:hypothetical protein